MRLLDFLADKSMDALREKMGANEYGHFLTFDPERHLLQAELEKLQQGMQLEASLLHQQPDRTLSYKNSRVWVLEAQTFHLANCETVKHLRRKQQQINISNQMLPNELLVCPKCLLELQYQGLDSRRMRRLDYVEQLVKNYRLDEYLQDYDVYPLAQV